MRLFGLAEHSLAEDTKIPVGVLFLNLRYLSSTTSDSFPPPPLSVHGSKRRQ